MKKCFKTFWCALVIAYGLPLAAQNKTTDSTSDSTQQAAETYLLQQREQLRIDSLVTAQLQKELQQGTSDAQRRKQLEDSLTQLLKKDSIRKAEQNNRITEIRHRAIRYPVSPFADTLFFIYSGIGSFSARERAEAISTRIRKLYNDPFFKADSLRVVQNGISYDVVYYSDNIITSVSDVDALWFDRSQDELANDYLQRIRSKVLAERKDNSVVSWLKRLSFVCLIIIGIALIIFVVNRAFNYLSEVLRVRREKDFRGIHIGKAHILTPEQHYIIASRVNKLLRLFIIVLAIYLALPLLFGLFPQTRTIADVLFSWILTPAKAVLNGLINFLPNLFTIAIIYIATRYLVKFIKYFASEVSKGAIQIPGFYSDWALPTFNIVRFLIYAFMVVVIFPYLPGSQSPAFRGVTVFLGILFSLGSSSAVANVVAGLVITYMRPFKRGDYVKIGDVVGDVIEKTMLVTRIRTIKNEDITVPNSTILSSHTINYSSSANEKGLIMNTTLTISYDVPWKKMHQALIDAALRTQHILHQPVPFVLQTSLNDFYVSYQLNAYTNKPNEQVMTYSELHQNIQDVCNERGIEIMSPHYHSMRDGNTTTIPDNYLKPDYEPRTFNVKMETKEKVE